MRGMTRRRFLRYGVGAGTVLALPWAARTPLATAAPGGKLTKYLEPVPLPGAGIVVATPSGTNRYSFTQTEIARQLHPELPPTPLWAYDDGSGLGGQSGSFGMAVVAHSGTPLDIDFTHDLPETYPDWIPVDTRLTPLGDEVRLMTHLHGGFVAADSDGNPAVTPTGSATARNRRPLHQPAAADAGVAALVPRPRTRRHSPERVRRPRRRLHRPRRARHRCRAEPDRHPRRRLRDPARRSRTASSIRTGPSSTRRAASRAPPGSASTSATSCSSTARSGRS